MAQGQQGHRDVGAARAGGLEPAGQPDRRRHAAQPLHRRRRRPLPRPQAKRGQGQHVDAAVRRDRRHRSLPRDGAARRSPSTARCARSRPACISTAWSTTTRRSPTRPGSTRPNGPRSTTCSPTRRRSRTPATPSSPWAATPSRPATSSTPLLAAVAGPDIYNRFYGETPDKTVFDEQGLRDDDRGVPQDHRPGRCRAGSTGSGTTPPTR